jgi:hypothetical protein
LPVSIKPTESKGNLTDPLNEIPYNLDFKDESDLPCQIDRSEENFDCYFDFEEDLTDLYDSVSYVSEDEWMPCLELKDDKPTIFSSEPNYNNRTLRPGHLYKGSGEAGGETR